MCLNAHKPTTSNPPTRPLTPPPHTHTQSTQAASASDTVTLVVKDWWFFVRVALEYDLGLARAYMAGRLEMNIHIYIDACIVCVYIYI